MSNVVINGIQLDAFSAGKSRLEVGDVAYLSVKFSEQVSVNTYNNQRIPILSLNTGGVARYVSGSGSDTLVFSYTVKATDNSTRIGESLSAIAFAENDAQILSTIDLQQSVATPRAADVSLRTSPVGTLPANAIVTPPVWLHGGDGDSAVF